VSEFIMKRCFGDPILDVMNFLNQVILENPQAISFAPGRPLESLFDVENTFKGIYNYVQAEAHRSSKPTETVWGSLGQYSWTSGFINQTIAKQLFHDENINVCPESIIITVGAQEAMAILLLGIFDVNEDVLLVSDPTYVGMTGLAKLLGIRLVPIPCGSNGVTAEALLLAIGKASSQGRARAIYDVPDFNNPLGTSVPLEERLKLLDLCHEHKLLYIEDNPYGMFCYDGEKLPTFKSLDKRGSVLYIASYSKTVFPGLRLGCLVADQMTSEGGRLALELSKVKSLITVNTSSICQCILASALASNNYTLEPLVSPKREYYRRCRDILLDCLSIEFADRTLFDWNCPRGGFFITLTLPFKCDSEDVRRCARDYGVIVCPMMFFSADSNRNSQVRLSFSYLAEHDIREGTRRFSRFCQERIRQLAYGKRV
jgi:(S)-3,5-dihydroxyphenylglycine transaminase